MSYIEDCFKEHIERMKSRERVLELAIATKTVELTTLNEERKELEMGVNNWVEESEFSLD